MDNGFPGFEIHKIHNPWILDGFGFTKEIHESMQSMKFIELQKKGAALA